MAEVGNLHTLPVTGWHRIVGFAIIMERLNIHQGINGMRLLPLSVDAPTPVSVSTMGFFPAATEVWSRWKDGEVVETVYGPKPEKG